MLLPLMATRQIKNIIIDVLIPWFKYKAHQKGYFKNLKKKSIKQKSGEEVKYFRRAYLNLKSNKVD